MYRPTFRNPPELCRAIQEIGAEAFLELLLDGKPVNRAYLDRLAPQMKSAVRERVKAKLTIASSDNRSPMETMYYAIMDWVSLHGRHAFSLVETCVREEDEFYIRLARCIVMLDHGGVVTADQVRELSVDWKALGQTVAPILRADPKWIAFTVVGRICAATKADYKTRRLVEASIGRIIEKNSRKNSDWAFNRDYTFVHHVVDWFKASLHREEPWLSNVDHLKRPKKLLKFGSFEALEAEVERQLGRRLASQRNAKLSHLDEKVVAEGIYFRIVRLLTKRALEEESRSMRHCIGHGAYDYALDEGECMLLSLRSKSGVAHGTLEVRSGMIVQFRGRANSDPKPVYRAAVSVLMPELAWGLLDDPLAA